MRIPHRKCMIYCTFRSNVCGQPRERVRNTYKYIYTCAYKSGERVLHRKCTIYCTFHSNVCGHERE